MLAPEIPRCARHNKVSFYAEYSSSRGNKASQSLPQLLAHSLTEGFCEQQDEKLLNMVAFFLAPWQRMYSKPFQSLWQSHNLFVN